MSTQAKLAAFRPRDLPAPPEAALRLVEACTKGDQDSRGLSEIVSKDPVLTAELMRLVNSAYFGYGREIASVSHAVTVIGQRALRSLVLCVSVRDAFRRQVLPGFDLSSYMDDALRRAVSARHLGERLGLDPDECFTAGLLQDFGTLVLFHVLPVQAGRWPELRQTPPDERLALERSLFDTTHEEVGEFLADAWQLPEDLAAVIAHHHQPPASLSESSRALCRVALGADWLAAVFSTENKTGALAGCRAALAGLFAMDATEAEGLIRAVLDDANEAAQGLGMRLSTQPSVEEVLRDANIQLAEENLSYQELTWRLQRAIEERDRLAEDLRKELELARDIQKSLLPGVAATPSMVSAVNISARQVSGDFYDHFALSDGRLAFTVADVSGKGLTAALLMAKTSSLFRCLGKTITEPGRLMAVINEELCETAVRGMFVTMVAGMYDPRTHELRLVNAGNPPAVIVGADGRCAEIEAVAPPLGIMAGSEFPEVTVPLDGGALYVFTDGLGEDSESPTGLPDTKRLTDTFVKHAVVPSSRRVQAVVREIHPDGSPLMDDITLLLIDPSPAPGNSA